MQNGASVKANYRISVRNYEIREKHEMVLIFVFFAYFVV
jgi:hypothetical protein